MRKNKKITVIILAAALVISVVLGGTLAYLTDSDTVVNSFSLSDVEIDLDEPNYDTANNEAKHFPGRTFLKDPTVTNEDSEAYLRVYLRFKDHESGAIITDDSRLNMIWQTIYTDDSYGSESDPITSNISDDVSYSLDDVEDCLGINTDAFTKDTDRSTPGETVYNYNGIFAENAAAVLFTNIVIPTDWDRAEIDILGDYDIEVYAEAIHTSNFADAAAAFAAFDTQKQAAATTTTEPPSEP
jgi:predicted ribosomally synthesized peptide with SipW-like signal peptide